MHIIKNPPTPPQDMLFFYFDAQIIDRAENDIRAVGSVVLLLLLGLAIVGMDWVTRVSDLSGHRLGH